LRSRVVKAGEEASFNFLPHGGEKTSYKGWLVRKEGGEKGKLEFGQEASCFHDRKKCLNPIHRLLSFSGGREECTSKPGVLFLTISLKGEGEGKISIYVQRKILPTSQGEATLSSCEINYLLIGCRGEEVTLSFR